VEVNVQRCQLGGDLGKEAQESGKARQRRSGVGHLCKVTFR
jgi:hypothetical protein